MLLLLKLLPWELQRLDSSYEGPSFSERKPPPHPTPLSIPLFLPPLLCFSPVSLSSFSLCVCVALSVCFFKLPTSYATYWKPLINTFIRARFFSSTNSPSCFPVFLSYIGSHLASWLCGAVKNRGLVFLISCLERAFCGTYQWHWS